MRSGMSDKELDEYLKAMEKTRKKICKNKKTALKFLVDAGIYTPKGNLRKPYRSK